MVFPIVPSIAFDEGNETLTRNLTSRIRLFNENDENPRGFNVFISALSGFDFKPINITKDLHADYAPPNYVIKIYYVNKQKLKINFKTALSANHLASNNKYLCKYNVQIPFGSFEVKGRTPIDSSYTEQYIFENLKIYNEINNSPSPKLVEVFRIPAKTTLANGSITISNSSNVILTFQGSHLPNHVILDQLIIPVFVQAESVRQCSKCWRFGHTQKGCKSSNELCCHCGEKPHDKTSLCTSRCINCKQNHSSNDKNCPLFLRLKENQALKAKNVLRIDNQVNLKKSFEYSSMEFPPLVQNKNTNKTISKPVTDENNISMYSSVTSINSEVATGNIVSTIEEPPTRRKRNHVDIPKGKNCASPSMLVSTSAINKVFDDKNWFNQLVVNIRSYMNHDDASIVLKEAINNKIQDFFCEGSGSLDPQYS